MAATPETLQVETPQVVEHPEEFPETIQQVTSGAQVVQKNFKSQISDDKGNPIIQTPPAQVVTVQPPSDQATLLQQSKGDTTNAVTWLAAFWIRIIKKAMFFGWKIITGSSNPNL